MIDDTLQAIAAPNRREILRLLADQPLPASDIAAHFDISRPAVSQHLKVLLQADLVTVTKHGTSRIYGIRREGLAELRDYLDSFWDKHLLLLKSAAEAEEARLSNKSNGDLQ